MKGNSNDDETKLFRFCVRNCVFGSCWNCTCGWYAGKGQAQVKSVYVDYQGEANIVFVDDMSAAGDDYTCGNDKLDRVAVDPKTETGKAMYSMALAAFVSGKRISVVASGECTIKPDVFDVWYMYIID